VLFIFDWDGTLCDSTEKIASCMVAAAKQCRMPKLEHHQVKEIIGLGLPEAIQMLFPGVGSGDLERMRTAYSAHFIEHDKTPSKLFDGADEVLSALKSAGIKVAIATGKSRRGLNRVLKNLAWDEVFHGSRCADETKSKPHPQMLHELLDEFDCKDEPQLCVNSLREILTVL